MPGSRWIQGPRCLRVKLRLAVIASVPAPTQQATPVQEAPVQEDSATQTEQPHSDPYAAPAAESFAWKDKTLVPSSTAIGKRPSQEQFVASPEHIPGVISNSSSREQLSTSPPANITLSPKASKSSLASSYSQVVNVGTGRRRVSVSMNPEEGKRGRSRSRASIRSVFPYFGIR